MDRVQWNWLLICAVNCLCLSRKYNNNGSLLLCIKYFMYPALDEGSVCAAVVAVALAKDWCVLWSVELKLITESTPIGFYAATQRISLKRVFTWMQEWDRNVITNEWMSSKWVSEWVSVSQSFSMTADDDVWSQAIQNNRNAKWKYARQFIN